MTNIKAFDNFETKEYLSVAGKLDPSLFAELIENPLHDGQREIASWFYGDKRKQWDYMSVLNSRRWGKTRLGSVLAAAELFIPNASVAVIGPDLTRGKEVFKLVKRYLGNLKRKGEISNFVAKEADKTIEIPELKSILRIASEDTFEDRIIGNSVTLLVLDETFLQTDSKVKEALEGIIPASTNYGVYEDTGCTVMKTISLSTPRNRPTATEAGRRHIKGTFKENGHISFTYNIYTSPFVTKETIEVFRKKLPELKFRREYLCEFAVDDTGVFPKFDREKHVIKVNFDELKKQSENLFLVTAADWGTSDANAYNMGVYNFKTGKGIILKEFFKGNTLFGDFIDLMIEEEEKLRKLLDISKSNILRFSDPAEKQGRLQAANKGFEMQRAFNKNELGYDMVNESFEGSYNKVIDAKEPDLYISEECSKTIQQIMTVEYKEVAGVKTTAIKKDTEHLHYDLVATIRYWVASVKRFMKQEDPILV